jgi:hypothetical protein
VLIVRGEGSGNVAMFGDSGNGPGIKLGPGWRVSFGQVDRKQGSRRGTGGSELVRAKRLKSRLDSNLLLMTGVED